jgi:valyl-tRNA synthetase
MDDETSATSESVTTDQLTAADKWILSKYNDLVKEVTDNMEKYELGIAADKIYSFMWEEFCDWYIEMVKPRLWDDNDTTKAAALWTLREVLSIGLKLLHPYMPFVTEEIYCTLTDDESIMIAPWPVAEESRDFALEAKNVDIIKDAVRAIRTVRTDMNVPPSRKAAVYVVSDKEDIRKVFEDSSSFFGTLGYASEVKVQADKTGIADDAVSAVIHNAVIYIPFADLVDVEKELERLNKEKARLEGEIKRGEGMLSNPNFVEKAPEAKVNAEKEKLAKYKETYEQVLERINTLK